MPALTSTLSSGVKINDNPGTFPSEGEIHIPNMNHFYIDISFDINDFI